MRPLDPKERLLRQSRGQEVDRPTLVGGWNLGVRNLAEMAGMMVEQYLADPPAGVLEANRRLGVDFMTPPVVPVDINAIRRGHMEQASFVGVEPEALKERAARIPATEAEVLARFDPAAAEQVLRKRYAEQVVLVGRFPMLWTSWDAVAHFSLYFNYGYEAFLAATALYPEAVERIWWEDAIIARERNVIRARLFREFDLAPVALSGCDICINTGPMVSPQFLRQRYWPHAKTSLAPLVDAGIRLICHCDGNVMPMIHDAVAAGFSGFQGFQYELGVDPYAMAKLRSLRGERMLFMAGLCVTRTLPFGTEDDVRADVDWCVDYSNGGQDLLLFPSNVTGVEVPPRNIMAAYHHLRERPAMPSGGAAVPPRTWPWKQTHPNVA